MNRSRTTTTSRVAILAGLLGAALLTGGTVAPAAAETVSRQDERGDAPARIDVVRATYTHDEDQVGVAARIPQLGTSGTAVLRVTRFGVFEAGYVVKIRQRPGMAARTTLHYFNHFDLEKRPCPGVAGTWGPRMVHLSVPRSCLVGHQRKRVFAEFGIWAARRIDDAPAVRRLRRS